MTRYLSILACSGLLSIGALYGAPAFAGSIPSSISDIAPTVGNAWNGDLGGGVQLVRGGGHGGGGHGGGGFHGGGRGDMHGHHFDHGRRVNNFFGGGPYYPCTPYYGSYDGSCYYGY